ncbi:MAG: metallophosphoesterase [Candidatus Nanosalina sp.]
MTKYSEAVSKLSQAITSKNKDLDGNQKAEIARELLKTENPENHTKRQNIEINLNQNQVETLQSYLRELEEAHNQEIGKEIQQTITNVEQVTDLRNQLENEVNQALSEAKELEHIAQRLQDQNIGNIAGKEEDKVRELGRKLEKINQEGKKIEQEKQKLEDTLRNHGIDRDSLHQELRRRAETVEKILDNAGSAGGGQSDLNQITNRIIQKESKLQEAESRGLQQLEDDIKTLSSIVELEEQEISALRQVENYLQNGNLGQASSTLDSLIQRRQNFGDQSRAVQQIKQDLQEEKKIIIALQEFFKSIKQLENKGISRDRLYQKMESQGSFSSAQEAKNFFEGLESEFEGIEEDIARVKKLEQKERKLENLEHEKLKEIDQEDSQLRQASSGQKRRKLSQIHEKLQKLGFSLGNEIESSPDSSSSDASSADPLKGPSKNEEWIVAISDIHGQFDMGIDTLQALDHAGYKPIVEKGSDGQWEKTNSNYKLVLNGDMMDRGPDNAKCTRWAINLCRRNDVEYLIGNHEIFYVSGIGSYWASNKRGPRNNFLDELSNGNIKGVFKDEKYLYLHAGQDFNGQLYRNLDEQDIIKKINSAIRNWRDVDDKHYLISDPNEFVNDHNKKEFWQQRAWCGDNTLAPEDHDSDRWGGRGPRGGIAWRDWNRGVSPRQIVGHRRRNESEFKNGSLNINTIRNNFVGSKGQGKGEPQSVEPGRSISIETPNKLFTLTRTDGDILPGEFGENRIKYREY